MFDQFRRFDTNDDYNLDTQEVETTYTVLISQYMLFASLEVRIVKTVTEVLKMLPGIAIYGVVIQ